MRERNVAILLFDEVEVLDFAGPFEVFSVTTELTEGRPFRVLTVARDSGPVRAIGGLKVLPECTLDDCPGPDILIVPGGTGSRAAMGDTVVVDWVKRASETAEIIMSVCSGARILARAGLLSGLRVTTHHQVVDHLRELAPDAELDPSRRYIDTGRVITTAGISAGLDGSLHVIARLLGADTARRTASYMEYEGRWFAAAGGER